MPTRSAVLFTVLQMLVENAPGYVFSQDVSQIVWPVDFPDGQISPSCSFLDPQLPDVQMPDFPSTPPRANALGGY